MDVEERELSLWGQWAPLEVGDGVVEGLGVLHAVQGDITVQGLIYPNVDKFAVTDVHLQVYKKNIYVLTATAKIRRSVVQ